MVQSFNWPAIRATMHVLLRRPALAMPHIEVADIRGLDFSQLVEAGCQGVVFDKDNTLTYPYADDVAPEIAGALRECYDIFDGRVAVLSNSAGTLDDPGGAAADRLERTLGIPVLRRAHKKPRGFEAVRAHFGGVDPATLVMVGDRYLTDVVFGNLHGMLSIHTQQLTSRGDNRIASLMKRLEDGLLALYRWMRIRPIPHRLIDSRPGGTFLSGWLPTSKSGADADKRKRGSVLRQRSSDAQSTRSRWMR
jgi:phosphatidylglycerophosphatase GEP4